MTKIRVAHESPISIMEQVDLRTDYCYALVHLCEKHEKYADHFINAKNYYNKEVLLDNSIFELGKSFDSVKFAEWIVKINPNYYIVPDVLEDAHLTIKGFDDFASDYSDLPGMKIGVVQGRTFSELTECYKFMADYADYIAISFDLSYYLVTGRGDTKLQHQCTGRQRFIKDLIYSGIWSWDKPHHLLGCSLAREFKFYTANNIFNIHSCDTSNPVVAGLMGLRYNGTLGLNTKPAQKLAELIEVDVSEDQHENIFYNISQFESIVS